MLRHLRHPWQSLKRLLTRRTLQRHPNQRGAHLFPPGHFYSPLLSIDSLPHGHSHLPHDGPELWDHVSLRLDAQRSLFTSLLDLPAPLPFPPHSSQDFRYHYQNDWFPLADAWLLSSLIRHQHPQRIIEVGSGFSTAVMLDTIDQEKAPVSLTCIEPYPERLLCLLRPEDHSRISLVKKSVQEVPLDLFQTLLPGDFLFIDSSHVAKIGSDVAFLFLKVLPALSPGVWIHIHDMFYPESYPATWIREGRAWNESLFLRALLVGNSQFEVSAFSSHALSTLPADFWSPFPAFRTQPGCSLWMRRVAT